MPSRVAVGWDLHRRFSQVSLLEQQDDGQFRTLRRARLEHADRDVMHAWLDQLPPGTPVAMEGAFGWQWVADFLAEAGLDPHLGGEKQRHASYLYRVNRNAEPVRPAAQPAE